MKRALFQKNYLQLTIVLLTFLAYSSPARDGSNGNKTVIRVSGYTNWAWNTPTRASRKAFSLWLGNNLDPATGRKWGQEIELAPDNPLNFPGFSLKLLNFAGGTGEEVITTEYEGPQRFFQYRDQHFLMPLNQFIWKIRKDKKGQPLLTDGRWDYELDSSGARILIWKDWENIPAGYRTMIMDGDNVMGLPLNKVGTVLVYRKDIFLQAGIDPEKPPQTWDELYDYSLRIAALGTPDFPKYGFFITDEIATLYTIGLGKDIAGRYRILPDGSKSSGLPDEPLVKNDSERGISELPARWESRYDSEEYAEAVKYLRKLKLVRWVSSPTHKPVVAWLPDTDRQPAIFSEELGGEGRWEGNPLSGNARLVFPLKTFSGAEIRTGCVFSEVGSGGVKTNVDKWYDLFYGADPKLGMAIRSASVLEQFANTVSDQWAFSRIPSGPAGAFTRASGKFGGLNNSLRGSPEKARLSWAVLSFMAGTDFEKLKLRTMINEGHGRFLPPALLEEEGYGTLLGEIPSSAKSYWNTLAECTKPEIPIKNFSVISGNYLAPVLNSAVKDENYDFISNLRAANREIQARIDFDSKKDMKLSYKILYSFAVLGVFLFIGLFSWKAFKSLGNSDDCRQARPDETSRWMKRSHLNAYVLLSPALALILLFNYYPIFAALPIAFQDYYVTGEREWVGLANFIEVFSNYETWISLLRSVYYLSVYITFGFLSPVILAILLSEIKLFQYSFRTAYYLPAIISGIIMLVLWQKFFEPTSAGLMNQMLAGLTDAINCMLPSSLHLKATEMDWLKHPVFGIPCIVFVHIWGHAGSSTLIYLAALKSIPEDLYEAAEIDGAGWFSRLRHISLSYLMPLLIINFVGSVIGSLQKSGEILPLAGNFPATRTFAVQLWSEAFAFCNFGVATALSWLLAAILVVFTIWNLNILRKVEFKKSAAE